MLQKKPRVSKIKAWRKLIGKIFKIIYIICICRKKPFFYSGNVNGFWKNYKQWFYRCLRDNEIFFLLFVIICYLLFWNKSIEFLIDKHMFVIMNIYILGVILNLFF